MLTGGAGADTYARDTLFAAAMLILNGILGISMLIGAFSYADNVHLHHHIRINVSTVSL